MTTVRRGIPANLPVQDPVRANTRKLARTLEGRENFTGVQVGGQNVKPFLDLTDGSKITSSAALDTGVVSTAKVASSAITAGATSSVGGVVALNAALETTIASRTYTTTGGELEIQANFHLTVWHPTAGGVSCRVRMYRDEVSIFDKTFVAISGDLIQGWQTPRAVETLSAGTYTYSVTAQASVSNYETGEADAATVSVREFKR
jgi:hypothetical protein